ncbi:MAG: drug/metabolite transporter (DMT)-like permease [Flavobacteriales bacterium]|jgi:drug/metabolite transporter (DMT)-like permease
MTVSKNNRPDRVTLAITLIVLSVFLMSVQETLFKLFSADLSLWQIFTLRGVLALPLIFVIFAVQGHRRSVWRSALSKWPLLRSLFMTLMFVAMYSAIPFLNLSTVAAGIYTAPVFVTLMSAYIIGEPVGPRGWVAIAMGFCGVLVILQPGADAFSFWAILPVFGGLMYALSNVTTRSKCQAVSPAALALSLNLTVLLAGVLISCLLMFWQPANELTSSYPFLFASWSVLSASEWGVILLLAGFTVALGMMVAAAYQSAPPSTVATFDYSYLIFMVLWDILFFSVALDGKTAIGILLIMSAGLLVMRRGSSPT